MTTNNLQCNACAFLLTRLQQCYAELFGFNGDTHEVHIAVEGRVKTVQAFGLNMGTDRKVPECKIG